jgi:hypothetical protein
MCLGRASRAAIGLRPPHADLINVCFGNVHVARVARDSGPQTGIVEQRRRKGTVEHECGCGLALLALAIVDESLKCA